MAHLRAQGGLKAMASRAGWLSDASHRIQFVYTPTHTSWLNQIELWFSENRRYIHGRKLTEARHVSYLPCAGRMGGVRTNAKRLEDRDALGRPVAL